jgi:arylsulfatase A-like enzyme
MQDQTQTGVTAQPAGSSGSGPRAGSAAGGWVNSLLALWRREFGRSEPTRVGDLVVLPIGLSAIAGLIMGVWFEATRSFLDPAFIAYSIGVDVFIQIVILLLALGLAVITRRRIWSGTLFAIAFFWYLLIPLMVHLMLPGADRRVALCIAVLGAFQIARSVNRHVHTRLGPWMIALPALIALCALSFGRIREFSLLSTTPKPQKTPNVLIIIVDTLRADHLSPYGYSRDTSPYLAQLAKQGVLFQNAIAPSSWTLPSHASMLTGLYPHDTGVETDMEDLSGSIPSLGDAMRKRGYRTGAFSANYQFFSRDRGFIHGFTHFEEYEQTIGGILEKVPLSRFILQRLSSHTIGDPFAFFGVKNAADAATVNDNALSWIHRGRLPFFVVLNYFDLHEPVLPPDPYLHMYTSDAKARKQSLYFPDVCSWSEVGASCDSRRPEYLDTYDGSIRYVDQSVQNLLYRLKQDGLLENTIVVFTSDHGQEFGEHGIYGHGKSLYWREIQVPLVIWNPRLIPASASVPTPVSTTDLPATILDLASPKNKQGLPGRSLADLWRSSDPASSWPAPLSELAKLHWRTKTAPNYNAPIDAIVTPEWHYIRQEGSDLLFDWKTDPEEAHDFCATQPTVCTALQAQLQKAEESPQQAH